MKRDFLVLKKLSEGGWSFFCFSWGEFIWGDLLKQVVKGALNFKKLNRTLFFLFLNLARLYSCIILTMLSYVFVTV